MYVCFANLGTRDILINNPEGLGRAGLKISLTTEGWLSKPREDGKRLWELYRDNEQIGIYIEAPIQMVWLEHVFEIIDHLDRLYLFVSDQPESTDERYRSKDTYWIGQILRKRLLDQAEQMNKSIGSIQVASIAGNPANYEGTIPFFEKSLRELLNHVNPQDVTCAYIVPVGGADASNVALMLQAVRLFRRKTELLYITPERKILPLGITQLLLGDYARQQGQALLERHDYAALGLLFDKLITADPWAKELCLYADRRMSFDFAGAQKALNEALNKSVGEKRTMVKQFAKTLEPLLRSKADFRLSPQSDDSPDKWEAWLDKEKYYLAELYFNLRLKADTDEWVDFLGRLFRMHEALLRHVFEKETHHSTGEKNGCFPDFEKWIDASHGERGYLESKKIKTNEPNTRVLKYLLRYWLENKENRGRELGPLKNWFDKVENLSGLRNKSIIAHGWVGVSKEDINTKFRSTNELLEETERVLEGQGVSLESDWEGTLQSVLKRILNIEE